jgi:phosphate transport system permease protein
MAVPVCLLAAMFITDYAPRRIARPLTSLIDLLAAVPAVIFGAWGFFFLQPHLLGVAKWLTDNLGFIPIFKTTSPIYAASPFVIGVVIALMMLPTGTSIMREVFSRAPIGEKEGVLALGGSRWRMMRRVVIPYGRSGIIGGSMLALGRAFGEAISVAIIISPIFYVNTHILQLGGNSIGALIATRFGDSTPDYGIPALMAAGLVLFLMTLLVNIGASLIVRRSRSGRGVD